MHLTLPLPPETEVELRKRAAAAGKDVAAYVLDVLRGELLERNGDADVGRLLTEDEWHEEFDAWLANQKSRNPSFDDSRESIYD